MPRPGLPKKVKVAVDDFVRALASVYGDGLVSVVLYGSAVRGEFGAYSNINMAVVLDDAGLKNLARASRILHNRRFAILDPVFFSADHIKNSADVFPLEFLDMKEHHTLLYGKDPFRDLTIDIRNLRFQCEQELKSKLLNAKRAYLRMKYTADLKNLLFKFFTSAMHILRNVLRLKGKEPAGAMDAVLEQLEREFGMDAATCKLILRAKAGAARLKRKDMERLLFAFTDELEKVAAIVDKGTGPA